MVIKKPYAFLIKHFRLIHGLLFALLLYLAFNTISIYSFFSSYATTHYYNQINLASSYVTPLMYIIIIVTLLVLFVIYFILSIKDKSNRLYLGGILYYIILLIFFIYIHSVFEGLEAVALGLEDVRFFRDISLIMVIPQIILLFIILGRTLGFNLKQFEFKRDLEEMNIDTSDSEEVELTVGNESYKIARSFRKFIRLSKYFLIENKLFVIAVSSLFILGLSIFVYSRINVYQRIHNANENVIAKNLSFKINSSYITAFDLSNNEIEEGKSFVLVNINVKNISKSTYTLGRETFKLKAKNEEVIPEYSAANNFYDFGEIFQPKELKGNEEGDYLVVFKISNENIAKEYEFRIKNLVENGNTTTFYESITVKPNNLDESVDKGTFQLPKKIELTDSILKNSTLEIESFDIKDRFKEPYKYTINNEIKKGVYSVIPKETDKGSVTLLKIKARVEIDNETFLKDVIKTPADLFDMYGILRYRSQGEYKNAKLEKLDVNYDKQTVSYLEIPKDAEESTKVDLIILIRGIKYTFNLK